MDTNSNGSGRSGARAASSAPWLGSRRFALGAALVVVLVAAGGAIGGYFAAKSGMLHTLRTALTEAMTGSQEPSWELYETQLGNFEKLTLSVADRDAIAMAALEEVDGHLIFLTQAGHFSMLSPDHTLRDLDLDLPMHTEEVRAAHIPNMDLTHFRALDLLVVPTGAHEFDLYASYDRYNVAGRCFEIAVSRAHLETTETVLTAATGWEDIYATRPCVPPRTAVSQFASAFVGIQSGGRLALQNEHTLLFSTGDLEFDGVMYPGLAEAPNGPQDPQWDLGKIIAIDLDNGHARHFARGFRNPQGLMVDASGRVWETEHGPYGGDEINLVARDGNYGWPNVTYGMMYVPLRENWPLNTTRGGHDGYDRPAYVFVPAIGISQLVEPSADEFPFWDRTLLITSLRGRALYAARFDGDRIMYAEPLPMGERLRDIINRSNGEIAILTDAGNLVLVRGAGEDEEDHGFAITDVRGRNSSTPAEDGRRLFAGNCQSCHSVTGQPSVGPPLNGVVGRDIAAAAFSYSAALRDAPGAWTPQRLTALLTAEASPYPGSTMPSPRLSRDEARSLVAYLRTTDPQ